MEAATGNLDDFEGRGYLRSRRHVNKFTML